MADEAFARQVFLGQADEELEALRAKEVAMQEEAARVQAEAKTALETEQAVVGDKMSHLQAPGEKCKKNQNSVSYDPITLKYHTTSAGQDLKYSDDIIKYRAAVRAKMMHSRSSGESCNIISWEPGREDKIKEPSKPVPFNPGSQQGPIG